MIKIINKNYQKNNNKSRFKNNNKKNKNYNKLNQILILDKNKIKFRIKSKIMKKDSFFQINLIKFKNNKIMIQKTKSIKKINKMKIIIILE